MNTKLNKITVVILMVLLMAVGTLAGCMSPEEAATKAVDALYTNEEKLLAEDISDEKVTAAKEAVEKVTDEDLKKDLTEKTEMAEKMYKVQKEAEAFYTEKDGKTLAADGLEKAKFESFDKNVKALEKEKPEFTKAMNEEVADARNYFNGRKAIDNMFTSTKRETAKDDATVAKYNEAVKTMDKIKNEDIKAQAKKGNDEAKKKIEAKEAEVKKAKEAKKAEEEAAIAAGSGYRDESGSYVAYTAEEIASNSGGYYEESYSGGYDGGGYYEDSYSGGGYYEDSYSGGGSTNQRGEDYVVDNGNNSTSGWAVEEWDGSGNIEGVVGFDPGAIGW